LIASDSAAEAVQLAKRNLSLLTPHGLDHRISELFNLLQQFGKQSHQDALENAETLKRSALGKPNVIETSVFQANALKADEIASHVPAQSVDVVFTDIPYGQQSHWQGIDAGLNEIDAARGPVWAMLNSMLPILAPGGLVIVASDKQQKASHEGYRRVEQFKVGKRQLVILEISKGK
jgi:23S rRNA (guanine2535-N1)-methyltransferase